MKNTLLILSLVLSQSSLVYAASGTADEIKSIQKIDLNILSTTDKLEVRSDLRSLIEIQDKLKKVNDVAQKNLSYKIQQNSAPLAFAGSVSAISGLFIYLDASLIHKSIIISRSGSIAAFTGLGVLTFSIGQDDPDFKKISILSPEELKKTNEDLLNQQNQILISLETILKKYDLSLDQNLTQE